MENANTTDLTQSSCNDFLFDKNCVSNYSKSLAADRDQKIS